MKTYEEWIFKSEHDIESAKVLLAHNLSDTAIYHTQQCAEKALKSFLAYKNTIIPKSHNLDELCLKCKNLDASFNNIYLNAIDLNGFDVRFSYPSAVLEPLVNDVQTAIDNAQEILDFVKSKCI
jgi:HEPN domain-containing protein